MTAIARPKLTVIDGKITTTSNQIAEHFGKRHTEVLRAIERLDCSPEFSQRNFASAEYLDEQGKKRPSYIITRDGFTFLAMGFTGKDAARWKESYIEAFNKLEQRAMDRAALLAVRKLEADRAATRRKSLPPPGMGYHYPRNMLDQPYFSSPKSGKAKLNISMLGDTVHYVSPLMSLLNHIRSEGHDISAPFEEAVAMRSAIQQAAEAFDQIRDLAIKAQFTPV